MWKKAPRVMSPQFVREISEALYGGTFDLQPEEIKLYLHCFDKGFTDGRVYEVLCVIERTLHIRIKEILVRKYGVKVAEWWKKGIPKDVRLECAKLREQDTEFDDNQRIPYTYTTFGNLRKILESDRNLFEQHVPLHAIGNPPDFEEFEMALGKLNKIRNRVMHPVTHYPPTEDDFHFVNEMRTKLEYNNWRQLPPSH
jgi:hypothetical protein